MLVFQFIIIASLIFTTSAKFSRPNKDSSCDSSYCDQADDLSTSCPNDDYDYCICGLGSDFWKVFLKCGQACYPNSYAQFTTPDGLKQSWCANIDYADYTSAYNSAYNSASKSLQNAKTTGGNGGGGAVATETAGSNGGSSPSGGSSGGSGGSSSGGSSSGGSSGSSSGGSGGSSSGSNGGGSGSDSNSGGSGGNGQKNDGIVVKASRAYWALLFLLFL
ncbi:uncharacterized protein KGF55_005676 [Candida pseudojiufengensis]|uniref:uncharacterized protein n=1 Tax=Candida pseudojiufengensis TaxID=497109 RepID=UPI0022248AB9|nr:uncharacterized protein KGF55_005676 [Candida pseudojiufengensis]KAI5958678.1 hypothetical protein KGF55_005676 [Candida pseudojiufengensis]